MAVKKNKQEVTGAVEKTEPLVTFSKERILSMTRYRSRRDLLSVLLTDGKPYTREEVDAAIKDFTGRKGN